MPWVASSLDDFSAFLLEDAGIAAPPVDVERLARHLGVARIVTTSLDGEIGNLRWLNSDLVISASRDASPARRRFTIAHEIAHLVLTDPRFDFRAVREKEGLGSDERFCDRLAESLLMPARWVLERCRDQPQELDTLLDFTRAFQVSAAAAAVRLQRIAGWSRSLLRFQASRGGWALLSVTAWSPEACASVRATAGTKAVLERFAVPETLSRLWLPLCAGGHSWVVGAELYGRDRWALALVNPRRRLPHAERSGRTVPSDADTACLKLFYSLDDIDACILASPTKPEGIDEERSTRTESSVAVAA